MSTTPHQHEIARLMDYYAALGARTTDTEEYKAGIRARIDVQLKALGTSLAEELAKQGGAA